MKNTPLGPFVAAAFSFLAFAGCDSNPSGPSAAVAPAKDDSAASTPEPEAKTKPGAKGVPKVKSADYAKP